MEEICKKHLNGFKSFDNVEVTGFIKSDDSYDLFTKDLISNGYSYSIRTSEKCRSIPLEGRSIRFDSSVPYTSGQTIYLTCNHGYLYYPIKNYGTDKQNYHLGKKTKFQIQNTKKIGCKSRLNVKIRNVFSDYASEKQNLTKWMKEKISEELKKKIANGMLLNMETWYYIRVSIYHNHEITGQQIQIHPELTSRITELVEKGITSTPKIKVLLGEKVKNMFKNEKVPDISNSAFFPNNAVIYYHVHNTLNLLKKRKLKQDALFNKE